MKRRIDLSQLQELTPEQQRKLREWWKPELHDVVLYEDEEVSIVDCYPGKQKLMLSSKDMYGDYEEVQKAVVLPLLDMGQMIQLLEEKDQCLNITKRTDLEGWGYEIILRHINYYDFSTGELADALWEAVKAVL
jgi:5'-3' exonuclease